MATKTKWLIDATHSEINFKVKHMMISNVTGHFEKFDGYVETETDSFKGAEFSFVAEIDSINTKNEQRDTHLKSDEFFDVATHPQLKFVSKSFDGSNLTGDLTIKGVTKEVTLDTDFNGIAVDPYGQTKAGFELQGSLNRTDFGLTWSAVTEAGNVVVSDTIKLIADIQFVKQ
ncbi:YceI family protein [Leeuwenhoekiella sp. A16]|uniref:YceI family protein n=1 Tax=unclassified Leeuwenhoekiella TaxID=2615029 RepID=UPI003A7FA756